MPEQEKYKRLMEKVIQETDNATIQSAEEMIQTLVYELSNGTNSAVDHS
ncbi:hypothetical protein GCM10008983_25730 [Lentibacillus halophilus]|uniref:Uncharacterized protein n=1 Tax=Lentibacillus halophilus TaxID=295065 RepID=A0ABP3JAC5_9BACI